VFLGIFIVLFLFFWRFFSFCRHPDGEPEAKFSRAGQDKLSILAAAMATGKAHPRFAGVSAYDFAVSLRCHGEVDPENWTGW